ncbi:MAG TPA: ATP-binding protein [Gemmataceae bacterium]|jgi:serine/threonine-protein kinase RsbW
MYHYDKEVRREDLWVELSLLPAARHVQASSLAELRPLFREVEDWMRVLGYPRVDIVSAGLALLEVLTNAFLHGNRGDPDKLVRVRYLVEPTEVLLEVEDEGDGFDPARAPGVPAGGGLFVARACTSWMGFNACGNRVTLCRRRSSPGPMRPV